MRVHIAVCCVGLGQAAGRQHELALCRRLAAAGLLAVCAHIRTPLLLQVLLQRLLSALSYLGAAGQRCPLHSDATS